MGLGEEELEGLQGEGQGVGGTEKLVTRPPRLQWAPKGGGGVGAVVIPVEDAHRGPGGGGKVS